MQHAKTRPLPFDICCKSTFKQIDQKTVICKGNNFLKMDKF